MNLFVLVWNYLKARPLNTAINIILLSLGISVIAILLLFNKQLEQKIEENARGIDLVVGAKGSPLQLILCNIFHIDYPTGNINLAEAERVSRSRHVKKAIPLALGDSYNGYRIIGTSRDYPDLYRAAISEGSWWNKPLDVTLGSSASKLAGLNIGDTFVSAHGLTGGHAHDEHRYIVTGILRPTNSILDNLILTSIESVWMVHEQAAAENEGELHNEQDVSVPVAERSPLVASVAKGDSTREITSLLLQYRSAMAAVQLPRLINSQTRLQAASPAFETARLFSILGVGLDILTGFAYVLIGIAALSIFIALYNSLKERRYDLAIMRSMGATRTKLFIAILLEGGVLTGIGCLIGLFLAHAVVEGTAAMMLSVEKAGLTGYVFYPEEWIILGGSLLLGLVCAIIPAVQAYRTDISRVLAGN